MQQIGFDRDKYINLQTEQILARRRQFGGKLYLEFGGKLFDDMHASRVLPGFTPDNKIVMLEKVADEVEIVVVISALDLANNKVRADLGIPYESDVLRLIDEFRSRGLYVGSVVISHVTEENRQALQLQAQAGAAGPQGLPAFPDQGLPQQCLAHRQ